METSPTSALLLAGVQVTLLLTLCACSPVSEEVVYSFTGGKDGGAAASKLLQASDGALYTTVFEGGANHDGAIVKLTTNGALTVLYPFAGSPMVQASDGHIYGFSSADDTNRSLVVFKMAPTGLLTVLHSFRAEDDAAESGGGLMQASDRYLYGVTSGGRKDRGMVFRMATNGTFTTIHCFRGGAGGDGPNGELVQDSDGALYGTTEYGGMHNLGTMFRVTTNGVATVLYSFTGVDGERPSGLVRGKDGHFYGVTRSGDARRPGTVFRVTTKGALATLHTFREKSDGGCPGGDLAMAVDGSFYGTAGSGGSHQGGTVYRITTNGDFSVLHSFGRGGDGAQPQAGVLIGRDGNLYGTTVDGGARGQGTVFRLILPRRAN